MAYTTIDDPSENFQIALYTGNGNSGKNIPLSSANYTDEYVGATMAPDLVWIKNRAISASHVLTDTTRGATKSIFSDQGNGESTEAQQLTAFGSNDFTLGTSNNVNDADEAHVAWCWKANGGTRTTNTESGNNPAGGYQANTTAGFSIVDYTGTGGAGTMAHGLGVVPQMIIVKERDNTQSWYIYHHTLGNNSELYLNTNEASASPAKWNSTTPTSTVFSLAANDGVNQDATGYITYCFAPIQGYSKFGSYTGNGNADGVFVYTGFAPAWVIQKRTNSSTDAHWHIFDIKRNTKNPRNTRLEGNNAFGDSTGEGADFLSNGFKWRSNDVRYNGSDDTYIYMAFAEHPFVSSEGVPCTAR